jgi:hypothetical protein
MRAMPGRRAWGTHPLVVGGLLGFFFLQMITASPTKSPTFDEPAHVGAGLSYLKTGTFKVNPQHPPLLKEIGALPLLAIGARFPASPEEWSGLGEKLPTAYQWQLGRSVILGNGPDRAMFSARLPFIGLAILLGGLIIVWGRKLIGSGAAAAGLLLYVFDPTILAHAPLVATDSGFATFTVLFLFALWSYLQTRTLKRLALCGGALGLVLASKFTAVVLLPVALALLLGAVVWIPAAMPRQASTLIDPFASGLTVKRSLWCLYAFLGMVLVAALVVEVAYFFPKNPFLYLDGIRRINADHDRTYLAYMAGGFAPHYFSYYLVCYLLKEPIPSILLAGFGALALLRRGAVPSLDRAFLFLPPAALFAAYSLFSDNLGFRYLIPALPFLHLIGGAGLTALVEKRGVVPRLVAAILCVWVVLAGTAIYPDHLSYFNELACATTTPSRIDLAGGWACGTLWLDDSNVDWGQGMKQLKTWLLSHPSRAPLRLGYFGSLPPEDYGIQASVVGVDDLMPPPQPGVYALSAHILARAYGRLRERFGDGEQNWLARREPSAVVGHAYYIYDIKESP